jgi:hypothetical protein
VVRRKNSTTFLMAIQRRWVHGAAYFAINFEQISVFNGGQGVQHFKRCRMKHSCESY